MVMDMTKYKKKSRPFRAAVVYSQGVKRGLAIEHLRFAQILLRRIVNEPAAAVLDDRDDLRGHFRRNCRATKSRTQRAVFTNDPAAHIISTMDHDRALHRVVVKPGIYTGDPQRKTIATSISARRYKETKAALAGLHPVGERRGVFTAGVDTMGNKG